MPAQPSRGELVVIAGALAALIGSFAPWFSAPSGFSSPNAWDVVYAPVSLYPLFAGLISGGVAALRRFANSTPAFRLGGYSWEQVHVLLGLLALLIALGFLFADRTGAGLGLGFWFTLGGSVALFVGALMMQREPRGPRRVY
jgi:hypothetical protein